MSNEGTVGERALEARPAGPCAMVIFGAGGDLTKRLVIPALYNLAIGNLLPMNFVLIGVDIADLTADQWRDNLNNMMQSFLAGGGEFQPKLIDHDVWEALLNKMSYLRGDFADDATFKKLGDLLQKAEDQRHTGGNVLFYLGQRFLGSNHIRQPQRVCKTMCGRPGGD
jgi:glucose-6-phosphate 1-dehydrogenase